MSKYDNYPGRPSYPGEGMEGDDTRCCHCGAWLKLAGHQSLQLASIVEGSDECTTTRLLMWPDSAERFCDVLTEIEREADEIWGRTHGCARCAVLHGLVNTSGKRVEREDGATPVHPECEACEGEVWRCDSAEAQGVRPGPRYMSLTPSMAR